MLVHVNCRYSKLKFLIYHVPWAIWNGSIAFWNLFFNRIVNRTVYISQDSWHSIKWLPVMFFYSRYNRTVHEYTASNVTQEPRVATLLLIQLLEGITHLTRYGVAHRDLKTDNLLLDESTSDLCPHLVIADFGCCLADQQWGLTLPFITEEIDRGGNSALMAPEVFFGCCFWLLLWFFCFVFFR